MFEYWKKTLSIEEQDAYERILGKMKREGRAGRTLFGGLLHGAADFLPRNVHPTRLTEIFQLVSYDHPELFYISPQMQFMVVGGATNLSFSSIYNNKEIAEIQRSLENTVSALKQELKEEQDELKIETTVLDYLAKDTKYEIDNINNQNLASVLYFKKSQCTGFSKAAKYLFDQVGIWCISVSGQASNNGQPMEPHAWNIVRVNGKYYHIDPTAYAGNSGAGRYRFINCSDSTFLKTHQWDRSKTPKCDDDMSMAEKNPVGAKTPLGQTGVEFRCWYDVKQHLLKTLQNNSAGTEFYVNVGSYRGEELSSMIQKILQQQLQSLRIYRQVKMSIVDTYVKIELL